MSSSHGIFAVSRRIAPSSDCSKCLHNSAKGGHSPHLAVHHCSLVFLDIFSQSSGVLATLQTELETYDAQIEWGEHESVVSLIHATVTPHMEACLRFVETLTLELVNVVQTLDEQVHHAIFNLNAHMIKVATNLETFKQQMHELRVTHEGDIEDCAQDHEEEGERNEGEMETLKDEIEDVAHKEQLDELLTKTFSQLDRIQQSYRDFKDKMLGIHFGFEGQIKEFFEWSTDVFAPMFGLQREVNTSQEFYSHFTPPSSREGKKFTSPKRIPRWCVSRLWGVVGDGGWVVQIGMGVEFT